MLKSLLICLLIAPALHAQTPANDEVRGAATRAVAIVQHGSAGFSKMMQCFSCHDHALPLMALNLARERGISVDEAAARQVENKAFGFSPDLTSLDRAVQDPMLVDPAVSDGWGLVAAHAAGMKPNLITGVYASRIASWQSPDGHWRTVDMRPPQSSSVFTATALALRVMHLYLSESMSAELKSHTDRALQWLFSAQPLSTEDFTFRLFGIFWGGGNGVECASAAKDLMALQRADGGWGELPHLPSDAYSTGEALVALSQAGGVATSDAAWQKGIEYLLSTQKPDGSWRVATRQVSPAAVSPPYFESGFPYGHDQYISTAATSWAAMALMMALPESAAPSVHAAPAIAATPPEPWVQTALFGSLKELKTLLNQGLDPNSKTAEGTTLLMMCANDPRKVELLISRGAEIGTSAKSGFTALMVAATYRGTSRSAKLLIEHGAEVNPAKGVEFEASPLALAAMAGDEDVVSTLLGDGANPNRPMQVIGLFSTTPLVAAVQFGNPEAALALLRAKADVRAKDPDGMTALHWATLGHHPDVIKELIQAGADVNAVDRFGYTALAYASTVDFGDAASVSTLLQGGADPNIKDASGKTAFDHGQDIPYVASTLASSAKR